MILILFIHIIYPYVCYSVSVIFLLAIWFAWTGVTLMLDNAVFVGITVFYMKISQRCLVNPYSWMLYPLLNLVVHVLSCLGRLRLHVASEWMNESIQSSSAFPTWMSSILEVFQAWVRWIDTILIQQIINSNDPIWQKIYTQPDPGNWPHAHRLL